MSVSSIIILVAISVYMMFIIVVSLITKAPDKEITDTFDEVQAELKA